MQFEQTQSIVNRIQQILREYPYGDSVLLELLQNADDASARTAAIYVENFHANQTHPAAKSPAVLFHNSSQFSARDLANIQNIGGLAEHSKRHDGTKVGRFGIGFNSGFHLSDVIAFVSGCHVVVFDPSKENLPRQANGVAVGGLKWNYLTDSGESEAEQEFLAGLLTAFENAGVGFNRAVEFLGTAFRFPLRTDASTLWREIHSGVDTLELARGFHKTASLGMVLLKNVVSIEAYSTINHGDQPTRMFRVSRETQNSSSQKQIVGWLERYTEVMKSVAVAADGADYSPDRDKETFIAALPRAQSYQVDVSVTRDLNRDVYFPSSAEVLDGKSVVDYTVVHQLGPAVWSDSKCWKIAEECARYHHPISVPWSAAILENHAPCPEARMMCFFPIKQTTGLPIHIHGYFQLSSDRQSISGVDRSPWNHAMCTEVVHLAYASLITSLQQTFGRKVYQLWPLKRFTDPTVALVATQTLKFLSTIPTIKVTPDTSTFSLPASVMFDTADIALDAHYAVASHSKTYATIVRSCDADDGVRRAADEEELAALRLMSLRMKEHGIHTQVASADFFRKELHGCRSKFSASIAAQLFRMCTDDENFDAFSRLDIPVIPLQNGSAISIQTATCATLWIVPDPLTLTLAMSHVSERDAVITYLDVLGDTTGVDVRSTLPTHKHHGMYSPSCLEQIDEATAVVLRRRLLALSKSSQSKLKVMTEDCMAALLTELFASSIPHLEKRVTNNDESWYYVQQGSGSSFSVKVMEAYLRVSCRHAASSFASVPILPVKRSLSSLKSGTDAEGVGQIGCEAPRGNIIVCCDPLDCDESVAQVILLLSMMGAAVLQTDILSFDVATLFKEQIHVIVPESSKEVISALNQVYSRDARRCEEALSSFIPLANGTDEAIQGSRILLNFLVASCETLHISDCTFLAGLPIFPTIWGSRIKLLDGSNVVMQLPTKSDAMVQAVIAELRKATPGKGVFEHFSLLESHYEQVNLATLLSKMLSVKEAPSLLLMAIAVPYKHEYSCGFFDELHKSGISKVEQHPLMEKALCIIADTAFIQPLVPIGEKTVKSRPVEKEDGQSMINELVSEPLEDQLLTPMMCVHEGAQSTEMITLLKHMMKFEGNKVRDGRTPALGKVVGVLGSSVASLENSRRLLGMRNSVDGETLVSLLTTYALSSSTTSHDLRVGHCITLIEALENSVSVSDSTKFVEELSKIPFVPIGDSQQKNVVLTEPVNAILPQHYELCPMVTRKPISTRLIKHAEKGRGLHRVSRMFNWNAPPTMQEMVQYINWCRVCRDKDEVKRVAVNIWTTYAHINEFVFENMDNTEQLKVLENLKSLYFPERGVSRGIGTLAMHPYGEEMAPFLGSADRSMASNFPYLFKLLRIPEIHSFQSILNTIMQIVERRSPDGILPENYQKMLAVALLYLVEVHPKETAEIAKEAGLPVPTTDGRVACSKNVMYDFYSTLETQQESSDVLHHSVSSTVARALGMTHTGAKFLQQLNPKYQRGAFKVRGQHQSLISSIRRILSDYSDPQSVLLEMLQNADDAGASTLKFYLDMRTFKSDEEGLLGKEMSRCLGPALVAYNDKMFTMKDFDAIMEIGCGHKAKDHTSIGRFGVGFNSVYHVTDCPSIISGAHTVFLDPAAAHLSCASREAPGVMIDHTMEPQLVKHFPGQFEMFKLYDVDLRNMYDGALFRLPLRRNPWESSVSATSWTPQGVRQLLNEMSEALPHIMLFLKNITDIQIIEIDAETGEQFMLHSAKFANKKDVCSYRDDVLSYAAVQHPEKPPTPPFVQKCVMRVLKTSFAHQETHSWLVSSAIGSPASVPADAQCTNPSLKLKMVPWTGCAIKMNEVGSLVANLTSMLHCFLPLPGKSGIPFHVHGTFALTSDRRGMWTESVGATQSWEMKWNLYLLGVLLPKAILHALRKADSNTIDVWPTPKTGVSPALAAVGAGFYESLIATDAPLFWCSNETFQSYSKCCFSSSTFSPLGESKKTRRQLTPELTAAVLSDEYHTFVSPEVFQAMDSASKTLATDPPQALTPGKVSRLLSSRARASTTHHVPFVALFPSMANITQTDKATVMSSVTAYCMEGEETSSLQSTPLILLTDGSVGIINKSQNLFVTSENRKEVESVFPEVVTHIVDPQYVKLLSRGGTSPAQLENCGVSSLKVENFRVLRTHLEKYVASTSFGQVTTWDGDFHSDFGRWLLSFWKMIDNKCSKIDSEFFNKSGEVKDWPLIPARRGTEPILVPLSEMKLLASGSADPIVTDALRHLGVWTLDPKFSPWRDIKRLCNVAEIDGQNLGDVLESALNKGRFNDMTAPQRLLLLEWLLKVNDLNVSIWGRVTTMFASTTRKGPLLPIIKKLPLFEQYSGNAWVYSSIGVSDSNVIPSEIPLTRICTGYYKKVCPEVDLNQCSLEAFFKRSVCPALMEVGGVEENFQISLFDELDYIRMIGQNRDLADAVGPHFGTRAVIPIIPPETVSIDARSRPHKHNLLSSVLSRFNSVSANETSRVTPQKVKKYSNLVSAIVEYIVDTKLDYKDDLQPFPDLVAKIRRHEMMRLSRAKRCIPNECVRPLVEKSLPLPNVLSILYALNPPAFTKIPVAEVLWDDPYIQKALVAMGIDDNIPFQCILEAATCIEECQVNRELRTKLHSVPENLPLISLSVGMLAVKNLKVNALSELCTKIFLADFTEDSLPCHHVSQCGQAFAPNSMAHHKDRLLVWTQMPLLHPTLSDFPIPPLPLGNVIAHLMFVLNEQATGSTIFDVQLVDDTLSSVYQYLSKTEISALEEFSVLKSGQAFALPRVENNPVVQVTSYNKIIALPQRLGSLAPFFYRVRDFDGTPATLRFVQSFVQPISPEASDVLEALDSCCAMHAKRATGEVSFEDNPFFAVHVELLKLLLAAAEAGKKTFGKASAIKSVVLDTAPIPLSGGGFAPLKKCCIGDNKLLLRRIRPGALYIVHPLLDFQMCRDLGIPSLGSIVREHPKTVRRLSHPHPSEGPINMFMRTVTFTRMLTRLLLGENSQQDTPSRSASSSKNLINAEELTRLKTMKILVVDSIKVSIVDIRHPSVQIGLSGEDLDADSPASATDRNGSRIYISMACARHIPIQYLLADELNKLLGTRIKNLSPLCAVLEFAAHHPDTMEECETLLDVFGIPSVGIPGRQEGLLVSDYLLSTFGKCTPAWDTDAPALVTTSVEYCGVMDATGLVKWSTNHGSNTTSKYGTAVVHFPPLFSYET